jgi:hypothetical protein
MRERNHKSTGFRAEQGATPIHDAASTARSSEAGRTSRLPPAGAFELDKEAKIVIVRIMRRAPCVPQRAANDGRERATTVTRSAEQIRQRRMFDLFAGPYVASWLMARGGVESPTRRPPTDREEAWPYLLGLLGGVRCVRRSRQARVLSVTTERRTRVGLGDAFHYKSAIGCEWGVCCRWLAWHGQCLKSRWLARCGHCGRLPPHHFPDDEPTNP